MIKIKEKHLYVTLHYNKKCKPFTTHFIKFNRKIH